MVPTSDTLTQRSILLQRLAIGSLFILTAACSDWAPAKCQDGTVCPPEFICSADKKTCISLKAPCGNGVIDEGEICDDGNVESGDACSWNCLAPANCGNEVEDPGEVCDPTVNPKCSFDCSALQDCGNGILDPGEECEVESAINDDRCVGCQLRWCGNERTDPDEVCDPTDPGSDFIETCNAQCTSTGLCGNGIVDIDEECDDANKASGDGCSSNCLSDETCGNGIIDSAVGETCDCGSEGELCAGRPNSDDGGPCRTDCKVHCNDGRLNQEEMASCDSNPVLHQFCINRSWDMGRLECDDGCKPQTNQCQNVHWSPITSPAELQAWNVWGIDDAGELRIFGQAGQVYRYMKTVNGTWAYEDMSPDPKEPISDVWGGTGTLYVVGENGFVQRYKRDNEDPWGSPVEIPWKPDRTEKDLLSVWGTPPILYAVGEGGAIVRSDGEAWTDRSIQTHDHLFDVWGTVVSDRRMDFFAVGQSGSIFHVRETKADNQWSSSNWAPLVPPVTNTLLGVWGKFNASENEIFLIAVGEAGTILHYHGQIRSSGGGLTGEWEQKPSPTTAKLSDVWGRGENDVYATGGDGKILHWDGVVWTPVRPEVPEPNENNFNSVWLSSAPDEPDIFIVSEAGLIHQLTPMPRE